MPGIVWGAKARLINKTELTDFYAAHILVGNTNNKQVVIRKNKAGVVAVGAADALRCGNPGDSLMTN